MIWKNYFEYTKSERIGIFVLLLFVFILLAIRIFFIPEIKRVRLSELEQKQLHRFQEQLSFREKKMQKKKYRTSFSNRKQSKLKLSGVFDPNDCTLEEWMKIGLTKKQASAIINYIQKGGRFDAPEDIRKMYTLNDQLCEQILPYIVIKQKKQTANGDKAAKTIMEKPTLHIQLNAADVEELQKISGIGPAFSQRIVKYRMLLGGFYAIDQLYEVYGLDSATVEKVKPCVLLDVNDLKLLNVNELSVGELNKHPYISKRMAYSIVQHRKENGNYKSLEALKTIKDMDPESLNKLWPYLTVK